MLHGANILCLSPIDWDFNWQLAQEVASAFAASGNSVLFVENTGVRAPAWKDAPRLRSRLVNWRRAGGGLRTVAPHLDVFAPVLLPFPYSRAALGVNLRIVLRIVRRWLAREPERPLIVVTFLPTPLARAVIRALNPMLVVYYCADRLSETSPGARRLQEHENALLAEADLVLTTSSGLLRTARELSSRAQMLAHGVRYREFERARKKRHSDAPPVFDTITGPVAGFVGSLRDAIDYALLVDVARRAPDMTFVLAGPVFNDVRKLAEVPNVRLVGPISHNDVMRHMIRFDVGILPYVHNAYTADVMPAKLKEYLAAGLPVVATRLPEVVHFAEEHPGVITFADTPAEFVAALRAAIGSNGEADIAHRTEVAERYDWDRQMQSMSDMIREAVAAKTRNG